MTADDLGASRGVNDGIFEAHRDGIVTSASLMVDGPGALDAARRAHTHPRLDVGLHVDLGEWVLRDGVWEERYRKVDLADAGAVRDEVERQLRRFDDLLGRPPTHVDSHQHVHRDPVVGDVVLAAVAPLGVPVRDRDDRVRYRGDFYGQGKYGEPMLEAVSEEALVHLIRSLDPGCTELGCHPGDPTGLDSDYAAERQLELVALCASSVRRAVEDGGVELIGFGQLSRLTR